MTCPSWVTLHGVAHSFIELRKLLRHDKVVIHEGAELDTTCLLLGGQSVILTIYVFKLNYSISDTTERKRVKSRLKKFITRRPSLKTLQEKGIIKDQVFGSYLHRVCERDGSTVPHFVKMCISTVEERGFYTPCHEPVAAGESLVFSHFVIPLGLPTSHIEFVALCWPGLRLPAVTQLDMYEFQSAKS
ncbi:Rho GTPase-activating protein 15 [Varanus komodoensis]|nr:Rho GTPase-activating protein 15 [Varanus komodoensis]